MSVQRVTRSSAVSTRSADRESLSEATPSRDVDPSSNASTGSRRLKKRRGRPPGKSELRELTPGPSTTSKKPLKKWSVVGGAHGSGRPAELYRTDFITAMKVNETDTSLDKEDWWVVSDPWRQDWNKGVQIPVDIASIPHAECRLAPAQMRVVLSSTNKQPKKLMCTHKTSLYSSDHHQWVQTAKKADQMCRYDLDDLDVRWLDSVNARRKKAGMEPVTEEQMELAMDRLESDCYESLQQALLEPSTNHRVGREFDENSACDICLSPDAEEEDEIVFCDGCDLCVHQSCYGVGVLPKGQWLCRSCALSPGKPPQCMLCPTTGGALKCTRSGERWAHVSCVLWIPEVGFGDPETLEPIVKVAEIPDDRWLLRCSVCDQKEGACIQCSVKNCRVAYHVTCAQRNHQYMKISQCASATDGVRLVSYCGKHSENGGVDVTTALWDDRAVSHSPELGRSETPQPSSSDTPSVFISYDTDYGTVARPESPRKRKARRLAQMEQTFFRHVDVDKVATALQLPVNVVSDVHEYWKLKRRLNANRPLLTPKDDEESLLERYEEEALIRRVRMLVALRQNLEKARNLCYMVEKREKTKRHYTTAMEALFTTLTQTMEDHSPNVGQMSQREVDRFANYLLPTNIYDEAIANNSSAVVDSADICDPSTDLQLISSPKPQSPKVADEAGRDINANMNAKLVAPLDADEASLRFRVSLRRAGGECTRQLQNTVSSVTELCASEPVTEVPSRKRRLRSSPPPSNLSKQRRLRNREVAYMLHNGARSAYAPVSRAPAVIPAPPMIRSKR